MAEIEKKSKEIKEKAKDFGFMNIGFAKAEFMPDEAQKLKDWLGLGYHGNMNYLEEHFEKRTDPTRLVQTSKTVISLAFNYYTPELQHDPEAPKISMYAYGRDYHKVVKKKLTNFCKWMEEKYGKFKHRSFIDSAPILEKDWAKKAGLGWMGKHTLLVNPKLGSCFFLAEIIVDFELIYDEPIQDHCGTCRKCIEACPTDAIDEKGYLMDGSKCISYLTIEYKEDEFPEEFKGKMENWAYGCDICQDVCPWNKFSTPHNEKDFQPRGGILELTKSDWENMTSEEFDEIFFGSPVKRTGYSGLMRNVKFLEKN